MPVLHSLDGFALHFPHRPFILRSVSPSPNVSLFSSLSAPSALLSLFAPFNVTLATANTYSHEKRSVAFSDYMRDISTRPVALSDDPDDTWYWVSASSTVGHLSPARALPTHLCAL